MPPRADPRRSGLREETTEESDSDVDPQHHQGRDNLPICMDVTADSGSETEEVTAIEENQEEESNDSSQGACKSPKLLTSSKKLGDEVTENIETTEDWRNFNASLGRIYNRIYNQYGHNSDELLRDRDNTLGGKSNFSEGDIVDPDYQEYLDTIDPYNDKTLSDDVMERRVAQLERQPPTSTRNPTPPTLDNKINYETNSDADAEDSDNTPGIPSKAPKPISDTPFSCNQQPQAKSTPLTGKVKKHLRFSEAVCIPGDPKEPSHKILLEKTPSVNINYGQAPKHSFNELLPLISLCLSSTESHETSTTDHSDRSSEDTDSLEEQQLPPLLISRNNIKASRQSLTYKRDNLVHFVTSDIESTTSTTRLLIDIGAINQMKLKETRSKVGQILVTPYKNHNILSVVIKHKYFDSLTIPNIKTALANLRTAMLQRNLTSFRISRKGDMLDTLEAGLLAQLLTETFEGSPITVTLCYGKVNCPEPEERSGIIQNLHESLIGGHKGVNQTYQKIRERHYWPGMRNDVLDYVRKCRECSMKKLDRTKTREPMIITDTPIEPFDKVSIDTVGKLRMTPRGNCHMLTMQCNLTKYLIVVPIPNLRSTTIANALAKHLICQFGAPKAILSDRGTSFLSDLTETLMKIFKIRHLTTSGYRPQTNGSLERSHAPLTDFIRTYSESYNDWDRLIPFAVFTYNTSLHSATKFTPYELVFGRIARFPLKIPVEEKLSTYNTYLRDLLLRLDEMNNIARENQIAAKTKSKTRYDSKEKKLKAKVGDYVYVLKEIRTSKFDKYYNKPLKIVEILGRNNAILELPDGRRIRKHIDKLKLAPE